MHSHPVRKPNVSRFTVKTGNPRTNITGEGFHGLTPLNLSVYFAVINIIRNPRGVFCTMELESSPSPLSLPPPSGSECGDSEGESPRATTVLPSKPFPEEVATVLESLYIRGMTGWGKRHSRDIESAIASTGLQLTQVKVY